MSISSNVRWERNAEFGVFEGCHMFFIVAVKRLRSCSSLVHHIIDKSGKDVIQCAVAYV